MAVGLVHFCKKQLTGGLSSAFYRDHAAALQEVNYSLLRKGVIFGTFQCGFLYVLTLLNDLISSLRWLYLGFTVFFLALTVLVVTVVRRRKTLVRPFYYLFAATIFALVIYLGTVVTPDLPAVTFFVFLIILPILYVTVPVHAVTVSLLATAIFCLVSQLVKGKTSPFLASTDMLNAICCCVVGIGVDVTILRLQLENIRAKAYYERKSSTDELTSLPNRRQFNLYIDDIYRNCEANHENLCILMLDIDDFKHYNDTYGHLAGDDCLRQVSLALKAVAQKQDVFLARYGGEEFVAVTCRPDTASLQALADAFVEAVRAQSLRHTGCAWRQVTVSVGCADLLTTGAQSYMALLNCADDALYAAKTTGKNRSKAHHYRAK